MRQGQEGTGEKALGVYEKVKVYEKDVELYRERLTKNALPAIRTGQWANQQPVWENSTPPCR